MISMRVRFVRNKFSAFVVTEKRRDDMTEAPKVTIRRATRDDADAIFLVLQACAPEIPVNLDGDERKDRIRGKIRDACLNGQSRVAVAGNQVIGFLLAFSRSEVGRSSGWSVRPASPPAVLATPVQPPRRSAVRRRTGRSAAVVRTRARNFWCSLVLTNSGTDVDADMNLSPILVVRGFRCARKRSIR